MAQPHPKLKFGHLGFPRRRAWAVLPKEGPGFRYTFHARYGIFQALRSLRGTQGKVVLVPAYDCPVVVQAIVDAGLRPRFYKIATDLSPDATDLRRKWASDVRAIIITNYFGFPADMAAVTDDMRQSALIIEDCAHSFLSCNPLRLAGGRGDVDVFAFWKIVPCMVGGGLAVTKAERSWQTATRAIPLVESLRISKRLLEQALENLDSPLLNHCLTYVDEKLVRVQSTKMKSSQADSANHTPSDETHFDELNPALIDASIPWLPRLILASADLQSIAEARRRNYQIFQDGIREGGRVRRVFRELPDDVCPWIFPLILEGRQRDRLDYQLRDQGVALYTFGSTLHAKVLNCGDADTLQNATFLAENLVCLSVHQDLAPAEAAASVEKINAFMDSCAFQ